MKSHPLFPSLLIALAAATAQAQDASAPPPPAESVLLDPLTVTGTRTSRTVTDAPVKTEVFAASEIEARGGFSLADSLRLMPSVRFENDCQNCGLNQIQLLGLSTDYTAILFDGAPLYSGLAKVYGASLFPTIFIDRIEVVKGSSSVLYGPEAIAGVVNLISEPPTVRSTRLTATYEVLPESTVSHEATFRSTVPFNQSRSGLTVYGLWTERDGLDLTGDGFTELGEFRNAVAGLQLLHQPAAGGRLKTTYQFLDQAHRGGDRLDLPEEQARVAESLQHQIHTLNVDWQRDLGPDASYEAKFAYTRVERGSFYGARADSEYTAFLDAGNPAFADEAAPTPAEEAALATFAEDPASQDAINAGGRLLHGDTVNDVFFGDLSARRTLGAHEVIVGFQARQEKLRDARPLDPAITETFDQFSTYGLFLQDIWSVRPNFELVPGLRADRHENVEGTILSPRLAARYEPVHDLILRGSYAGGFNAPGAFNEDAHIGGTITLRNSPGLREERADTYSAGFEWYPAAFKRRFGLNSTLYHTRLRDSFEIDDTGAATGDASLWLRINGPDARILAWENGFNWILADGLKLEGSLSHIRARFATPIARVTGLETREFVERPEWTGLLSLAYRTGAWESFVAYTFTGEMLAVGEESDRFRRTDAFHEVDLGLTRAFTVGRGTTLKVGVGVKNLFDSYQDDLENNGEARDVTYLYGPTRPRSVYLSVGAQF